MEDQNQQRQQNTVPGEVHAPGNVFTPTGQPSAAQTSQNPINQEQAFLSPETYTFNPSTPLQIAPSFQPSASPTKKSRKRIILASTSLILLLLIGGGAYAMFMRHKPMTATSSNTSLQIPQNQAANSNSTGYQTAIQKFVGAVENKDKVTADSLEDQAAQASFKQNFGTTSFYDSCQQSGVLCTGVFAQSFLSKSTISYKDYSATNGTKGKEGVYTIKESASGTQAGGQGCSSGSTTTLGVAVVPSGSTWFVDTVDLNINANANLCPVSGSTQ